MDPPWRETVMHYLTLATIVLLFYGVKGLKFRWTASVCRSSGIATSRETSIVSTVVQSASNVSFQSISYGTR